MIRMRLTREDMPFRKQDVASGSRHRLMMHLGAIHPSLVSRIGSSLGKVPLRRTLSVNLPLANHE